MTESSKENKISITYPKLSANNADYSKVNQMVKNAIDEFLNEYCHAYNVIPNEDLQKWQWNNEYTVLALDVEYQIMLKNDELLSIAFEGLFNSKMDAHPIHIFFTLNINLQSLQKVKLNDVYTVNQKFINIFRETAANIPDRQESKQYVNDYSNNELIQGFTNADTFESGIWSYFTEDKLGLSFPTIYVLGDHVETEIGYNRIEDNRKK